MFTCPCTQISWKIINFSFPHRPLPFCILNAFLFESLGSVTYSISPYLSIGCKGLSGGRINFTVIEIPFQAVLKPGHFLLSLSFSNCQFTVKESLWNS